MTIAIRSIGIYDDIAKTELDQRTAVLGMGIYNLNVWVQIYPNGSPRDDYPKSIAVTAMSYEPGSRVPGSGSMNQPLALTLKQNRQDPTWYSGHATMEELYGFTKIDDVPEFATVVRSGGTSDQKFRGALRGKGWRFRGSGVQPAAGAPDLTGDSVKEEPDAKTLFRAGGVEVLEVKVSDKQNLAVAPRDSAWVFVRSPADVMFYSGHGAWWDGNLLVELPGDHNYRDWIGPKEVLAAWNGNDPRSRCKSADDLDCLIINGCSVLFWNRLNEKVSDVNKKSYGLDWAELLYTRQGPLQSLLGYRTTAPLDFSYGNLTAEAMGRAIATELGTNYDRYAPKWLEINARHQATWSAAAIDPMGYWHLNLPFQPGYDSKRKPGEIMGPFPIP